MPVTSRCCCAGPSSHTRGPCAGCSMSEDPPAQDQAAGQPAGMVEHHSLYQVLQHAGPAAADEHQQQHQQHMAQAPFCAPGHPPGILHTKGGQPQHGMQQVHQGHHAAGAWCGGPMAHPYGTPTPSGLQGGCPAPPGWPGPAAAAQHQAGLPAAYSRLSIAGAADAVADAQRQTDQCMGPAGMPAQQQHPYVVWAMQRAAGHPGSSAARPDMDAAKLKADQHVQGQQAQALSVEVGTGRSHRKQGIAHC